MELIHHALEHAIELAGPQSAFFAAFQASVIAQTIKDYTINPKTILDYGCGEGTLSYLLSHYIPDAHIHGFDTNAELIDIAQQWYQPNNKNLIFLQKTGGAYDAVFLANVLHHIPHQEQKKIIEQIIKQLTPNGLLIILELNPYNIMQSWRFYRDKQERGNKMVWPGYIQKMLSEYGNVSVTFHKNTEPRGMQRLLNKIKQNSVYSAVLRKDGGI